MAASVFQTLAQDTTVVDSRGLICLPFRPDLLSTTTVNGATTQNNDGTRTGTFNIISASASWANSVTIELWINGPVFGLRFPRNSAWPVGCVIDAVAYPVQYGQARNPVTFATTSSGLADQTIIADDLGDGPHFVQLHLPCSTATSRTAQLMGFLVDARTNAVPPPPRGVHIENTAKALTTSFQSVTPSNQASYGISGVHFVNTTGAAITVNIRYSSANGVFWSRSVPANDTLDYTPPGGRPIYHAIELSASTTGVNAFIGGLN